MRQPRLKLDSSKEAGFYHCISRTAGSEWLLGDAEKEVLRRQLWAVAEYCGLEILTYALMSNHYHLLVRVPKKRQVGNAELLRRFRALHPVLKDHQQRALEEVRRSMDQGGAIAQRWRERQLRQMFDVSHFNKLLKMRFSIWYNHSHGRKGTLWSERFKSVLVESGEALRSVAAYIDLNCVRAGITRDPRSYRYCGYAEALAGAQHARRGIELVCQKPWKECADRYRCMLFGVAGKPREDGVTIDAAEVRRVLEARGQLSMSTLLRCRVRYFVDGLILGSAEFVLGKSAELLGANPSTADEPRGRVPPLMRERGLCVFGQLRGPAIHAPVLA